MTTPATARAHVFVDDLDSPVLTPDDHRHLTRALRLPAGADITVADGRGRWRHGRLQLHTAVEPVGDIVTEPAPHPEITVAFALVKGGRPELIVQKLTELGVDRIVAFTADRSVVRWDAAKAERQVARWRVIAREAAMQCRRARLPDIWPLGDVAAPARLPGAVRADRDGQSPSLERPVILVGPEGGWSDNERDLGIPTVRLGDNVLRAETAAITAGAIFAALRSGLITTVEPLVQHDVSNDLHRS